MIIRHFDFANVWVGLERMRPGSRVWKWTDDEIEPANSSRWEMGEPNNIYGIEHCAELLGEIARLNDASCMLLKLALCERRAS